MDIGFKYVSIIIPTYREWHLLVKCIHALNAQSYPSESFEVIIVNNDPNDAIPKDLVLPQNFKIIDESKPGSYAARNTALKMAKGEIIGFTDSDCIVDKNWIKNAVDYLQENANCDRVAGSIQIIQKSAKPTVIEKYNQLYAFPQKWLIENGGGSVTANLFVHKYVFDKIGGFDESLMSMGDKFWGMKAQKAGFNIHFVENVIVHHPARNLAELIKKEKRHGGAVQKDPKKKRLKLFIDFAYQFRPRVSGMRFMLGKRVGVRIIDRVTIPFLRHYLLLVRSYEALRVQLGKAPNRT
ncbi:glycosyltransferase family 2 protein [Chitinophagaceae bacterium LB-8]|jgi:glycosyltransferase involved in cell wall biosynthesis|uniref:Glycosyltransferase family 2 protein n=1 Tax=Paraflavisolibacter caeni TaxID=2982496 RepID=A0A9X2XTT6_9BACT|nr:glycosyltransferase family A protein [Paraflavisolibacter caeni]MCU7548266.1 glycosyltransferase family 2 protein [Paraflavisolibacter caeni]